jgi:nucleoid-associated protein YgaU
VPATIPRRSPAGALPSATISIVVPRGAALWTILRRVYGDRFPASDRSQLYRRVRELNPQVANVNLIFAGDRLRVPAPPRTGAAVRRGE